MTELNLARQLLLCDIHHEVEKKRLRNQQRGKPDRRNDWVWLRIPTKPEYILTDEDKATLLAEDGLTIRHTQHETTHCHCGRGARPDWEFCRCAPTMECYYEISW